MFCLVVLNQATGVYNQYCGISPNPRLIGIVATGMASGIKSWRSLFISSSLMRHPWPLHCCLLSYQPVELKTGLARGERASSTSSCNMKSRTADCSGADLPGISWRRSLKMNLLFIGNGDRKSLVWHSASLVFDCVSGTY